MTQGFRSHSRLGAARSAAAAALVLLLLGGAGALYFAVRSAGGPRSTPTTPEQATPGGGVLDAILSAARQYLDKAELDKADVVLSAAIREHPEVQPLYTMQAELRLAQRKPEEAYAAYEKALAIGPRTGDIEFAAGTAAAMTSKLDRAVEHYSAAQLSLKTDYKPSLFLAQVQLKLKQREEAKANLILAGRLNPDVGVIWGTLAQIALDENTLQTAVQHATRARELEPRVTLWRVIEARARRRQGEPDKALELLIGLDELEQRDRPVMQLMAECYGMLNKPAEAAALYVKAADAAPTDGQLALEAALWLEKSGDKAEAIRYAEHAKMLGTDGAIATVDRLHK